MCARLCLCVSSTKANDGLIKKVIKVSLGSELWGAGTLQIKPGATLRAGRAGTGLGYVRLTGRPSMNSTERHYSGLDKLHSTDASPPPIQTSFFIPIIPFLLLTVNPYAPSVQLEHQWKLPTSSSLFYQHNPSLPTQTLNLILIQLLQSSSHMSTVSHWLRSCCPWK